MPMNNEIQLIPKLRFPEFENSGGWNQTTIGELGNFYYGKSAPKWSVTDDAKTPCVRYGELYTKFGTIISKIYSKTNIDPKTLRFSKGGEILIPRVGEDPQDFANCCYLPYPNIAIGEMISVLETQENGIFYSYYFRTMRKQFADVVEGQNVKNLYYAKLFPIKIGRPTSKSEQQKIADCLTSIDELIDAEGQKLEALKRHKKGLMQQLFPTEGQTTPTLRFPEFENSGEWEEAKINDIFDLLDGFPFSSTDFVEQREDSIQVIRITDINNQNKNDNKVYLSYAMANSLGVMNCAVVRGDLLLSLTGAAGFNFFVWDSEPALLNQRTLKITAKKSYNHNMTKIISNLIYDQINEIGSGQNNNLSKEALKRIKFYMPKPLEQEYLANLVASIDDLITAQNEKITAIKNLKKGLMQQLFPDIGCE